MKGIISLIAFLLCMHSNWNGWGQKKVADKDATKQTNRLYRNMAKLRKKGVMFGHQDDLAYGIGWKNIDGESDVKRVVGEYPAVFGWDLGHLELDSTNNLDGVPFAKIKQYITEIHARGGISTLTWHLRNPINGKSAWDVDTVAKHILVGGANEQVYQQWLAKIAGFLNDLKDADGKPIPVIFRPFHEHNGSWFWWGQSFCSPQEYKLLYQQFVNSLKEKGVHHVLYAYSTDNFASKEAYLERYPGDNFVDILGFDTYHRNAPASNDAFVSNLDRMLTTLDELAKEKKKLTAITETGLEQVTEANWWTNILLKGMANHPISYVLVWRNGRPDHYYAPYINQKSADNFKQFVNNPSILLEQKTRQANLYK
jgi:mannan endo-1,4-beta-mannosidase